MAGLTDQVDDSPDTTGSSSSSSGSSSSSSSSSDDEWPRYEEDTPYMAVIRTGDNVIVRNRPQEVSITYRQYSPTDEMTKWDTPDNLIKYWHTDWLYKKDRHAYEEEYPDSEFSGDLREDPILTLKRLRKAKSATDDSTPSTPDPKCKVCGETFNSKTEYERIQGIRVCPTHTVNELVENKVVGNNRSKNRRWE